jgi:hypothetical protein
MFIKRWEFFGRRAKYGFKSWRADTAAALCVWLMIILVFGAIFLLTQKYLNVGKAEPPKPTPQEVERGLIERFEITAKKINDNAPTMLDENTRLDWASVGPGARLTYHYTLTKYSSEDIDPNSITNNVRPFLKNKVCAKMEESPQSGGTYVFSYSGNNGVQIASFQFDRNDCGLPKITP